MAHSHHDDVLPPHHSPAETLGDSAHSSSHESSTGSVHHDMSGHAMAFHFGSAETILFNFWHVQTTIGIILSCIVVIASCFLLEFVRWYRLFRKQQRISGETESLQDSSTRPNVLNIAGDSMLHAVQLAISYALMLVFMTFNVWLCIAVIVGEVSARALLSVMFPKFDRLLDALSATEACCG